MCLCRLLSRHKGILYLRLEPHLTRGAASGRHKLGHLGIRVKPRVQRINNDQRLKAIKTKFCVYF